MPEFAPGIPSHEEYGDLSKLPVNKLIDLVTQKHLATRAGPHTDLRIGTPDLGLYSWALRKGLPEPGKKHLGIQTQLHSHDYGQFEGEIPKGKYGAGTVKKEREGQVLITKVTPNEVHFTTASERYPERYALIKSKDEDSKQWLLVNITPTKVLPGSEKVHYKNIPASKAEDILSNLKPGSTVQEKVDGAAGLFQLLKNRAEVASYRVSKINKRPIMHTERFFQGISPKLDIPPSLAGTVLRGEIYGEREGKGIPPQELGGLLNSALAKSLSQQQAKGTDLKSMIFDIHQLGKKPMNLETPYDERRKAIEQVLKYLPQDKFHLPEEARDPKSALKLWKHIASGDYPRTEEGVVIHPSTGIPSKIKLRNEADVIIRNLFPGKGKYTGLGSGGFQYSHTPKGQVVGEVGTGFSDETRKEMFTNPEKYLGQTARVTYQNKKPSGALFGPSFISLHQDYLKP